MFSIHVLEVILFEYGYLLGLTRFEVVESVEVLHCIERIY